MSNLLGGVGASLDTLNELSKALNDDSHFATTVTNMISTVSTAKLNNLTVQSPLSLIGDLLKIDLNIKFQESM